MNFTLFGRGILRSFLLAKIEWQLRFSRSALGPFWNVLMIALISLVISYVGFAVFSEGDLTEIRAYVLSGFIFWFYFSSVVSVGMSSVISNGGLMHSIAVPVWVYSVKEAVLAQISLLISLPLIPVLCFEVFFDGEIKLLWFAGWMFSTFFLASITIYSLGLVCAKYRDVASFFSLVLQMAFYATPVVWPVELLSNRGLELFLNLNPLVFLVSSFRYSLGLIPSPVGSVYSVILTGVVIIAVSALLRAKFERRVVYWV